MLRKKTLHKFKNEIKSVLAYLVIKIKIHAIFTFQKKLFKSMLIHYYSCGNVQNESNGKCYEDVFNQRYILLYILSSAKINIYGNSTFEQNMVYFSINWLYKVFQQPNFGFGFEEVEIDKIYWMVDGSTVWYGSKA